MSSYKEIVTKAVIGKGRKTSKSSFQVQTEERPNTILGCWVINHRFDGTNDGNLVHINGAFDVNIWYSYDNDTKTTVSTKRISYDEEMNVRLKEQVSPSHTEIIVRSLKQPTVTDVKITDGLVDLEVEKELGVELVGDSKFKVMTDEGEEDWDEIEDTSIEEDMNEINEDYIQE